MLIIRDEQLAVFARLQRQKYELALAAHLRAGSPEKLAPLDEVEVRELVRSGVEQASAYGIEICYDVTRFVEYRVRYGPGFEGLPGNEWIRAILEQPALGGTEKMDRIDAEIARRLRGETP